jgi:hypothetical protein
MRILSVLFLICAAAVPGPGEIPAGTVLEARLTSKIATKTSHIGDPVEAVVIAPIILDNRVVIPAGTALKGKIGKIQAVDASHPRASVSVDFQELTTKTGGKTDVVAQLVQVDNARETVDETGQVIGISGGETLSSRMDEGLKRLGSRLSSLASVLQEAKKSVINESDPEIDFGPGVEFSLKLTKPVADPGPGSDLAEYAQPIRPESELILLVNRQPFQTAAEKPPKPSDLTNLMFLGSQEEIAKAFREAGWFSAAALNTKAKLETLRAIVEERGYSEAPVSVLLLDNQKPDMVFQKANNTFASRHHLRIWKRPETFQGREVWVCAATHDIGIDFSAENRTFIHKIDSQIDRERAKVVFDLLFTGLVGGLALVDRPEVPQESGNATGDKLITDARMAVLDLAEKRP